MTLIVTFLKKINIVSIFFNRKRQGYQTYSACVVYLIHLSVVVNNLEHVTFDLLLKT